MKQLFSLLFLVFGFGLVVHAAPLPALTVSSASVLEGNSGKRTVTLQVKLAKASKKAVQVQVLTASETALSSEDYVSNYQMLTFAPGTTSKTFSVSVLGDTKVEKDEHFDVLASADDYASKNPAATCTIRNDDFAPTPTPRPTATPTPRPTPTATPTPKPTATSAPTATPQPTATAAPQPSATPGPTATPKPTAAPTATSAPTATPQPTATTGPTATPKPTPTSIPTPAKGKLLLYARVNGVIGTYVMNADGSNRTMLPAGLTGENWSPDGTKMQVYNSITESSCITTPTGKFINSIPYTGEWSPDGTKILIWLVGNESYTLSISNADGTNLHTIWKSRMIFECSWSPDSSHVVFTSEAEIVKPQIYVASADGSEVVNVSNNSLYEVAANWSADSKRLLVTSRTSSDYNSPGTISVMAADGSNRKLILQGYPGVLEAKWSFDEKKIAFTDGGDGHPVSGCGLHIADADGTHVIDWSRYPQIDNRILWSPNSQKLLTSAIGHVYIIDVAKSQAIELRYLQFPWGANAVWSPDATKVGWIGVEKLMGENWHIIVGNLDGTGATDISPDTHLMATYVSWTTGFIPPPSGASPARGPSSAPAS